MTFRNARRAENGGFIEMDRLPNGKVWDVFVSELWELQWTNINTPLTQELSIKLYDLSLGILDVAVRIYKKAQELIIGSSDERITSEVLEMAYRSSCKLTHTGLNLLRQNKSGSTKGRNVIKEHYDDLILDDDQSWLPASDDTQSNSKSTRKKANPQTTNPTNIPGDLTRAQHPEFAEKIAELQNVVNLHDRIVDADLFQRAANEENPLHFLKKAGMICDDPLSQLS